MSEFIPNNENDIIDIDLSVTSKKKFRFDQDNSRIVALNVSDLNIVNRISTAYPKLQALQVKAGSLPISQDNSAESVELLANSLSEIDSEMRELIDYIFDADVSSKAAPDGSMYDPFDGTFRYEYILNVLVEQYGNNLKNEAKKIKEQSRKHTDKYTRG